MKKFIVMLLTLALCLTLAVPALAFESTALVDNYGGMFWFDSAEFRETRSVNASSLGYSQLTVLAIKTGTKCGIGGSMDYGMSVPFLKATYDAATGAVTNAKYISLQLGDDLMCTTDELMTMAAAYPGNALFMTGTDARESGSAKQLYLVTLDGAAVQKPMAYANSQSILIDEKPVSLTTYALKDANGGLTNYVKLRDIAHLLNGTAAQFEVSWDGAVNILSGKPYTPNGTEMTVPFTGDQPYTIPTAMTKLDGQERGDLSAITLTDANGGGYTYYKLRDLGQLLDFDVSWSQEKGIYVNTDQPYTPD